MFDTEGFDTKGGAELLAVMAEAQRDERVAVARRLLAAGRLCQLRMADVDAEERFQWCVDNWEAVAAEVGAELGISRRRASTQMNYGVELLERLPKLAAAFAAGEVDFRVVAVAVFRTGLVTDEDVLAAIDARLAAAAPRWNAYSNTRIAELVDWWVREADPAAERSARSSDADRNVTIGPTRDGLTEFWGALRAPDAAALDRRLTKLTATVCRNDPRTRQQRRADAMAVLTAGGTSMACGCESADCPKREAVAEPGQIVIHLMAEAVFDRTAELQRLSETHRPRVTLSRADEFQHPHVSAGTFCLGRTSALVTRLLEKRELYNLVNEARDVIELFESTGDQRQAAHEQTIGDAEGFFCDDGKATWKWQQGAARIDTKRLRAEMPDVADAYTVRGDDQRILRVKGAKK